MSKHLIFLRSLLALATAVILILALLLWWFQVSDYSHGRQQIGILAAPDVVNTSAIESLLQDRSPRTSSDWWNHFYSHQSPVWQLAWVSLLVGAGLTLAAAVSVWRLGKAMSVASR